MSERILVCTHGEPGALGALRLANALARREGYALDVLAVIAPVFLEGVTLYALPGEYVSAEGEWVDTYRERIREQLRALGGALAGVEPQVEIGHVAHTIAAYAESQRDVMILLGAGKHGRAERWGGGETSLYVSRLARVPVLAVPADATALPQVGVAAVDFSEYSRDAALSAARLLGPGGRLHLVHATWLDSPDVPGYGDWVATYESGAQTRMEGLARELRAQRPLQSLETEVLSGDPTERVLQRAHQTGAGLVAAGSHGHGFFTRMLLGSTSTELLRGAGCSVRRARCPPSWRGRRSAATRRSAVRPAVWCPRWWADAGAGRPARTAPAGRVPDSTEEGTMRIATNESPLDRALRVVVGAVLGWLYLSGYVTGATAAVALVVSLVLLITGIVGYCPMYALLRRGAASMR